MIPGEAVKKMVGLFIPDENLENLEAIDNLTGDELRNKLHEFSNMRMEMFFKGPSAADKGKSIVNEISGQVASLESILVNIGGAKQELRPSESSPDINEVRQLVDKLRNEGLSIAQIDKDYAVFGKSPLDKDIDPATLKVMVQRMREDFARYRQIRTELEGEAPDRSDAPDNGLSPASTAPIPGMNMRPGG